MKLIKSFFYLATFISCIFLCTQNVSAKTNEASLQTLAGSDVQYTTDRQNNQISFITNESRNLPVNATSLTGLQANSVADLFMNQYGLYFGMNNGSSVLMLNQSEDDLGMSHVRYNQYYDKVPVYGAQTVVHVNSDLTIASANGKMVPDINVDTNPTLSANEAANIATELWNEEFPKGTPEVRKSKLFIYNHGLVRNKSEFNDQTYLIWQVDLFQQDPPLHEIYFIDAHTGKLVNQITGMWDAVDRDVYDCSYNYPGYGLCYIDTLYGGYYYGRSEGQVARGAQPSLGYYDTDYLYNYLGGLYNYYYNNYGLNGANGEGGMGDDISYAATSTTGFTFLDYSYYYAYCPNAFFNSANSIYFCQTYVTSDITGHEYAHAVNYFTITDAYGDPAGQTYQDESGALNEANSDIFGEAFEYYYDGSNNWEMGEDLTGGAIRSMKQPSDFAYDLGFGAQYYPESTYDSGFYCGDSDYGGVHINMTVPAYAAYLMAIGGTYNGCTIDAIGRTAEEAIYYRALNSYFTQSTTFNEAYDDLIAACGDLYGATSDTCAQVQKALMAVEMDQGGVCSTEAEVTPDCSSVGGVAYVTSANSNTEDGYYKAGDVIDVDIIFSDSITSSGNVIVTLETGDTDATCSFSITNSNFSTCNYTVQAGDNSSDLSVKSVTGTVTNSSSETGNISASPITNLDDYKDIVIDTVVPYIKNVTSTRKNGHYKKGKNINITVNFSEKVTSSGKVRVKLETGKTDRNCKFKVNNKKQGSCKYKVQAKDKSKDLNNKKIKGTLTDQAGNVMTNMTPNKKLKQKKNIKIDTKKPTGSISINYGDYYTFYDDVTLSLSRSDNWSGVKSMRFSMDGRKWSSWKKYSNTKTWNITDSKYGGYNGSGYVTVYVQFRDKANNRSATYSDYIYHYDWY